MGPLHSPFPSSFPWYCHCGVDEEARGRSTPQQEVLRDEVQEPPQTVGARRYVSPARRRASPSQDSIGATLHKAARDPLKCVIYLFILVFLFYYCLEGCRDLFHKGSPALLACLLYPISWFFHHLFPKEKIVVFLSKQLNSTQFLHLNSSTSTNHSALQNSFVSTRESTV